MVLTIIILNSHEKLFNPSSFLPGGDGGDGGDDEDDDDDYYNGDNNGDDDDDADINFGDKEGGMCFTILTTNIDIELNSYLASRFRRMKQKKWS